MYMFVKGGAPMGALGRKLGCLASPGSDGFGCGAKGVHVGGLYRHIGPLPGKRRRRKGTETLLAKVSACLTQPLAGCNFAPARFWCKRPMGLLQDQRPRHDRKRKKQSFQPDSQRAKATLSSLAPIIPGVTEKGSKRNKKKRKLAEEPNGLADPAASNSHTVGTGLDPPTAGASPGTLRQDAAVTYSSVGDHDLAHSSKPIRKHIYHEHPEISRLSAAAAASWRQQRAVQVKGSNLNPVLRFEQAGQFSAMPASLPHCRN